MRGYNFTERVRKALAFAREEAARLHHEYIGSEHQLLGLVREGEGVAAVMLQNLNAPLDEVRERVESLLKSGTREPPGQNLAYTSRAEHVFELAMTEARYANHAYVGTEHLLLGIFAEGRGIAAEALTSFGLTVEDLRGEMHRILGNAPVGDTGTAIPPLTEFRKPSEMNAASGALARLPERIEAVLGESYKVATRAGATHLECLHVAIGLLVHRAGTAIAALERIGCDVPRLAAELQTLLPATVSTATAQTVPFALAFVDVLGAAEEERQRSREPIIGTHHLLLALLERCPDVAQPLNKYGVTASRLRIEATRIVG
jgi:ATP-dependent Clp protease ATP-binding subunit ClpA